MSTNTNEALRAQLRTPRQIRQSGQRDAQSMAAKRRNAAMPMALVMAMPLAKGWRNVASTASRIGGVNVGVVA